MTDIVERLRNWRHAAFRRDGSTLGTMTEAADEIVRLRAELAECKKDAERYRWLREMPNADWLDVKFCGSDLDLVIDAALKDKP